MSRAPLVCDGFAQDVALQDLDENPGPHEELQQESAIQAVRAVHNRVQVRDQRGRGGKVPQSVLQDR